MMFRSSRLALTVFVGFLLLLPFCLNYAADPQPAKLNPHWGKAVSGLSCSIRTDKTKYVTGEDILIDFLLRSEVEVPTKVIRPWILMSYLGMALPLEITGPKKDQYEYTGPVLEPPPPYGKSAYVELTGGEIIGASSFFHQAVRIVPKYWSMLEPGEYTIRFKFVRQRNECWDGKQRKMIPMTAWQGELTSNAVTIRIGEK